MAPLYEQLGIADQDGWFNLPADRSRSVFRVVTHPSTVDYPRAHRYSGRVSTRRCHISSGYTGAYRYSGAYRSPRTRAALDPLNLSGGLLQAEGSDPLALWQTRADARVARATARADARLKKLLDLAQLRANSSLPQTLQNLTEPTLSNAAVGHGPKHSGSSNLKSRKLPRRLPKLSAAKLGRHPMYSRLTGHKKFVAS